MMETELRITDLRMSDLGRYYCIYFNPHGHLNRSIILERGDGKNEIKNCLWWRSGPILKRNATLGIRYTFHIPFTIKNNISKKCRSLGFT